MKVHSSHHQERIWFIDKFERGSLYENGPTYHNIPIIIQSDQALNIDAAAKATAFLVKRHETLRTHAEVEDNTVYQVIDEDRLTQLQHITIDDSVISETDIVENLVQICDNAFSSGMDGALFKVYYTDRLANGKTYILFCIHHFVCDDRSCSILASDFSKAYTAILNGEEPELGSIELQYADFSNWQNSLPKKYINNSYLQWKKKLGDNIQALELPIDVQREAIHIYSAKTEKRIIKPEFSGKIERFCKDKHISPKFFFIAAFKILLSKYSRLERIVIGTSMTDRSQQELYKVIGPISNLVVLDDSIYEEDSVSDIIKNVEKTYAEAAKNSVIPFDLLVTMLKPKNDMSRTALFDVLFNYVDESDLEDCAPFTRIDYNRGFGKYDYNMLVKKSDGGFSVLLAYNELYYYGDTVDRLLDGFFLICDQLINKYNDTVANITCCPSGDYDKIINKWNSIDTSIISEDRIDTVFSEQAKKYPGNIAVKDQDSSITYGELEKKSDGMAAVIVSNGITSNNDTIAIILDKSVDCIAAMLSILKAGAAYLPIDPTLPSDRISYMLNDSKPSLVIYQKKYEEFVAGTGVKAIDIELLIKQSDYVDKSFERKNDASAPAYIIYTSGTTGNPKGAVISHKNVTSLINNGRALFSISDTDVWTMFHSYCFDFSVWEMYGALLAGGKLVIVNKDTARNINEFRHCLIDNKVTVLNQTPFAFYALEAEESMQSDFLLSSIRMVIFGGEALSVEKLKDWVSRYPECQMVNMYGITETTVHVTYKFITKEEIEEGKDSIGVTLPTYTTYIMDSMHNLVPVGVAGELVVGGSGVALGYLNRPELTSSKFITNDALGRLYCSGDLCRWGRDGTLEYLGRIDQQVKIRGFRVELGEVTNVLRHQPGVKEAIVIDRLNQDGDKALCAYYVADAAINSGTLKNGMSQFLPEYMLPVHFMQIDSIPLTRNGKVNRAALPEIQVTSESDYVAPISPTQKLVAGIFSEILNVNKVGINDNFFSLGGHSLRAVKVLKRITAKTGITIPLKDLFANPTVAWLSQRIDVLSGNDSEIPKAPVKKSYRATPTQKRIHLLCQLDNTGIVYNMPGIIRFADNLDRDRAEMAFNQLVSRHEILRTRFVDDNGEVVQIIDKNAKLNIKFVNSDEDEAVLLKEFVKPFDLSKAPLMRVMVTKRSDNSYIALYDIHHIVADGISIEILKSEFVRIYDGEHLDTPELQFKDYSEWVNNRSFEKQKQYWTEVVKDIPTLDLPLDHPRPKQQTFTGSGCICHLSEDLVDGIQKFVRTNGITDYMFFLSALTILLGKYSRSEDIVLGTPISGRVNSSMEEMIGMFVNTLLIRSKPKRDKLYTAYLDEIKDICVKAFENQEVDFDEVVRLAGKKSSLSRNPLFDVMFAMQNAEDDSLSVVTDNTDGDHTISKFDLSFIITATGKSYEVFVEYCTDLYEESTVKYMLEHYCRILESIVANSNSKISELSALSSKEKQLVTQSFNNTEAEYYKGNIWGLFELQAKANTNRPAVKDERGTWTYSELKYYAERAAQALLGRGMEVGTVIAVAAERRKETFAAILGVLKAGAVYLPVDPAYPKDRVDFMLSDSGVKLVISFDGDLKTESLPVLGAEELFGNAQAAQKNVEVFADSLAYIIYTSGTTGKPKGTLIAHRGVLNLASVFVKQIGITAKDVILQFASLSFDASVWEWSMALLNGAELLLISRENITDIGGFSRYVRENGVTVATLPPAFYDQLPDDCGIRTIITAGSEADWRLVKKTGERYINAYGPTEVTVCATMWIADGVKENMRTVPIGKPLINTKVYMFNGNELCGIGIPGELCVSGAGLSQGYLNRDEQTAKVFTENPETGEKMYRTGDLARWLPDGNIEYLGRIDEQVKIRGYRVEPSEIEQLIKKRGDVRDAAVVVRTDKKGEKMLCAYIVGDVDTEEVKRGISSQLPSYMIPSYFAKIDSIPFNVNGKVDKAKLPVPEYQTDNNYSEPENDNQRGLCRIYEDVLHTDKIGIDSDFFEIGGHSIAAMSAAAMIQQQYGVNVTMENIINNPTVRKLSEFLENNKQRYYAIHRVKEQKYYKLSLLQENMWTSAVLDKSSTAMNICQAMTIHDCSEKTLRNALVYLLKRNEVLRTRFVSVDSTPMMMFVPVEECEDEIIKTVKPDDSKTIYAFVQSAIRKEMQKPFDIENDWLVRMMIIPHSDENCTLIFSINHIIADASSMYNLFSQLLQNINAVENGREIAVENDGLTYADFTYWLDDLQRSDLYDENRNYWQNQLSSPLPCIELITDYQRPTVRNQDGDCIHISFSGEEMSIIKQISSRAGSTLFVALMAIVNVLLYESTCQEQFVIGIISSLRERMELERLVGLFLNVLPIRTKFSESDSFDDIVRIVKDQFMAALEHKMFSFSDMIKDANVRRIPGHSPVFDVLVQLVEDQFDSSDKVTIIPTESKQSKYDLVFNFYHTPSALTLDLEYSTQLFKRDTVESMADSLHHVVEFAGSSSTEPISSINSSVDMLVPIKRTH